jgi:hypothetical protein
MRLTCPPFGVPNIALGIKRVLPQVPTRQVLVPWYMRLVKLFACAALSLSLSLSFHSDPYLAWKAANGEVPSGEDLVFFT